MYKNILTIIALTTPFAVMATEVRDGDELELKLGRFNPTGPLDPHQKSPIQIPLVYQDGNTLTFATPCTGCTLELRDSNGDVVYSDTIAAGTTLVNLPDASLLGGSGTYELRLVYGSYYFYAIVVL